MIDKNDSQEIVLGADGTYRWVYELSLYRNPTVLFLVLKIFMSVLAGMYIFMMLLQIGDGLPEAFRQITPVFAWLALGMLGLLIISYYLYAALIGGKYCVLFEMDEKGVKHIQIQRQFKKAQVLGQLLVIAGAMTGKVGAVGQGMLVGSKQATYSSFKKVKRILPNRRLGVIKVNSSDLVHNQVYVEPSDFDFVLGYIEEHVRLAKTVKKAKTAKIAKATKVTKTATTEKKISEQKQ